MIKLNKEDVVTAKLGENFMISCKNNIRLILTPEAIEELLEDYNNIKNNIENIENNKNE
ncbi:MAG: hypothetical protein ACOC1O_00730 [bacterium]